MNTLGFDIVTNDIKGRHAIARQKYRQGDIVIEENPFVFVIVQEYRHIACSHCCRLCIDQKIYSITSDDTVHYCSEQCIMNSFKMNVLERKSLQLLESVGVEGSGINSCRLVLKLACLRKIERESDAISARNDRNIPRIGRENSFEDIMLLEASTRGFSDDLVEIIHQTATSLSEIAHKCNLDLTSHEAAHLLFAISCNAHQIVDSQDRGLAIGLFPMTSMLNHSCEPNCSHSFVLSDNINPSLVMRCLRDIESGEELCYSYVHLYQSTAARQQQLLSTYCFQCDCKRCNDSISDIDNGDFSIGSLRNYDLDDDCDDLDEDDAVAVQGLKLLTSLSSISNSSERIDSLHKVLSYLESQTVLNLPPQHIVLFKVYNTLVSLVIGLDDLASLSLHSLKSTVGYGIVALGCISKYIHLRHFEQAKLESHIATVLRVISSVDDAKPVEISVNSDLVIQLTQILLSGDDWLIGYPWLKEDEVLEPLITLALTSSLSAVNSVDLLNAADGSDSFSSLLASLFEKSSSNTSLVCRGSLG